MTSQLPAGVQRRPFPATGGLPRGPVRQLSQTDTSASGSRSNKVFVDLTEHDDGVAEGEHPAKRQKLDTTVKSAINVLGTPRQPCSQGALEGNELKRQQQLLLWRGKSPPPWCFPEHLSSAGYEVSTASASKDTETPLPQGPPPLPPRHWKNTVSVDKQDRRAVVERKRTTDGEVQTTPYRLEAPDLAPALKEDLHADFFPWTGNHPEDVMNEQTAKSGYYDRVQVSQNETNTARPSLYTVFKNRSGLQTLSALLVAAGEQRRAQRKINADSTFKPPPRVTLTEAKRKAWLSDLANPAASLRRLSRTIPQGVRGQMLLDQCLAHSIPIGRAVWFAKCVGANEIRTLKRKGTSGSFAVAAEAKWVKDWTSNVEQFVEGVVADCGEVRWKDKITYALRFAARLYYENLLDQSHYLDWIVTSLSASTLDRLPLWLLLMRIYWPDLIRYRKTAKVLAENLLDKLQQASKLEPEMIPIVQRLSQIIRGFVHIRATCFLLPQSWSRHGSTLKSCLDLSNTTDKQIFDILERKHERLIGHQARATGESGGSSRQEVIKVLDSVKAPYDFAAISKDCLRVTSNADNLAITVLEWASSRFREGESRTYIALRLLRRWQKSGMNIDSAIMQVLVPHPPNSTQDMTTLFHIFAELVRSQSFSLGRYMQGLMARGMLNKGNPANFANLQALREVPLYHLPAHIQNLRNTLLSRAGISVLDESHTIAEIKSWLHAELPGLFIIRDGASNQTPPSTPDFGTPAWTIKSDVSQWIRSHVAEHYYSRTPDHESKSGAETREISALSVDEFQLIRDVLERMGDLSMLADVVRDGCNTSDALLLSNAVDTINYHLETFSAIGALHELHRVAFDTYTALKSSGAPSRQLIICFLDLSVRLPSETTILRSLQQDLVRDERTTAVAAFSPLSDNMADSLQYTGVTSNEDLDQLIPLGSNVDEQTLARIFGSLIDRLESGDLEGKQNPSTISQTLWRLRASKSKQFDSLMLKWVEKILQTPDRPPLIRLMGPLIGTGCISFSSFVSVTQKLLAVESVKPIVAGSSEVRIELLRLICPRRSTLPGPLDSVAYRFRFAQKRYIFSQPSEVLSIFKGAIMELADSSGAHSILQEPSITETLHACVVHHMEAVREDLVNPLVKHSTASARLLASTMDALFNQSATKAQNLILLTNDFSLPFCQLRMKLLLDADLNMSTGASGDVTEGGVIEALFEMAKSNVEAGSTHWTSLVSTLGSDATQHLREKAEEQFLSVATLSSPSSTLSDPTTIIRPASIYLKIIEALAYAIPASGVPAMAPILVEKMTSLLRYVTVLQSYDHRSLEVATAHFGLLLRLASIHRNTFLAYRNGPMDQARLLIAITSLALNPLLAPYPVINSHALDVCAVLVDDLSDDARLQCVRFLRDKTRDPRVCFLFGFGLDRDPGLRVYSKTKGVVDFKRKSWEMLEDATPKIGINDTSVSLTLFQARKIRV